MERHGVPKRPQASTPSSVLNLNFLAASRKMKGQLPLDIQQLRAIAAHFGESASVLVEPEEVAEDGANTRAHAATFTIDNMSDPCTAWTARAGQSFDAAQLSQKDQLKKSLNAITPSLNLPTLQF